jgi:hypothetical protein
VSSGQGVLGRDGVNPQQPNDAPTVDPALENSGDDDQSGSGDCASDSTESGLSLFDCV